MLFELVQDNARYFSVNQGRSRSDIKTILPNEFKGFQGNLMALKEIKDR